MLNVGRPGVFDDADRESSLDPMVDRSIIIDRLLVNFVGPSQNCLRIDTGVFDDADHDHGKVFFARHLID